MKITYQIIDYCWHTSSFELKREEDFRSYWVNAHDITEKSLDQDYCQRLIGKTVETNLTPSLYSAIDAVIIN